MRYKSLIRQTGGANPEQKHCATAPYITKIHIAYGRIYVRTNHATHSLVAYIAGKLLMKYCNKGLRFVWHEGNPHVIVEPNLQSSPRCMLTHCKQNYERSRSIDTDTLINPFIGQGVWAVLNSKARMEYKTNLARSKCHEKDWLNIHRAANLENYRIPPAQHWPKHGRWHYPVFHLTNHWILEN